MKKLLFLTSLFVTQLSYGQVTIEKERDAVIETTLIIFEGMKKGDSSIVSSVLHPDIRMQTVVKQPTGVVTVQTENSADKFLTAIGTPHDAVYDERTWGYQVNVEGDLATVWMNYAFYAGDTFSHCGINSFQLVKSDGKWEIIYIIDTRRREPCNIPDKIKK